MKYKLYGFSEVDEKGRRMTIKKARRYKKPVLLGTYQSEARMEDALNAAEGYLIEIVAEFSSTGG